MRRACLYGIRVTLVTRYSTEMILSCAGGVFPNKRQLFQQGWQPTGRLLFTKSVGSEKGNQTIHGKSHQKKRSWQKNLPNPRVFLSFKSLHSSLALKHGFLFASILPPRGVAEKSNPLLVMLENIKKLHQTEKKADPWGVLFLWTAPEGIPNIRQTHALTTSVLTSSLDHVQNLLPQSCGIRSFVFLHLVGIHDDCKEHIHQEKYHDDHEKPKPNSSPEQACCTLWATTGRIIKDMLNPCETRQIPTLQGTNISHLGKRKIILKSAFKRG